MTELEYEESLLEECLEIKIYMQIRDGLPGLDSLRYGNAAIERFNNGNALLFLKEKFDNMII